MNEVSEVSFQTISLARLTPNAKLGVAYYDYSILDLKMYLIYILRSHIARLAIGHTRC
jgi:hypothetical protein